MEFFAKEEAEWLRGFLELPGSRFYDTFGRVFHSGLQGPLTESFMAWVNAAAEDHPADVISWMERPPGAPSTRLQRSPRSIS